MKVGRALAETSERLTEARCDTPRVDAEILVAHVLGVARSQLALETSRKLSRDEEQELERLAARRVTREPLAYVLGEWGFRRLTLASTDGSSFHAPRRRSSSSGASRGLPPCGEPRVLDVGTGSGAIALAIVDEHPGAQVTAIDASAGALEVAGANAARTGLAIALREWDLYRGLPDGPWDLVVSNPPYVLPDEIDALEPEVRDWEPREALVGVGATEAVARGARDVLREGGALVLEVAAGNAGRVTRMLDDLGYEELVTTRDLAGRDRVVEGVRSE